MPSKTAIEFVFDAAEMKGICEGSKKIVITSYLEEVKTQGGEKVGAMRVKAQGKGVSKTKKFESAIIYGCPDPPCEVN
jgi:hypothetical protein